MKHRKKIAILLTVVIALFISISFCNEDTFAAYEEDSEQEYKEDEEREYLDSVEDYSGGTPSEIDYYGGFDYLIDSYDINIVVNENNRLDITETLIVYFNVPKYSKKT